MTNKEEKKEDLVIVGVRKEYLGRIIEETKASLDNLSQFSDVVKKGFDLMDGDKYIEKRVVDAAIVRLKKEIAKRRLDWLCISKDEVKGLEDALEILTTAVERN